MYRVQSAILLGVLGWGVSAWGQLADPILEPIEKGPESLELELVVDGLVSPLGLLFPDDGSGRMFVYDQVGIVHVVEEGAITGTLLDVGSRLTPLSPAYDERGLLGMALHPDFASNGRLYTYTSEPDLGGADFTVDTGGSPMHHQSVIAEWVVVGNAVDTGTRREIMRVDQPQTNHNGGAMNFGQDGNLYIAFGDGGGARDTATGHGTIGNGQDTSTVHGALLRINVDGVGTPSANGQYTIPADNPFVGSAGLDEIYAYGFRNPYSFSFDPFTGQLYVGDVGQGDIEEVDVVEKGGNYGWRVMEGAFLFDTGGFVTGPGPVPGLTDPIASYDHDEGTAIIGGKVYRGGHLSLDGHYITGDFARDAGTPSGRLLYLDSDNIFKEFIIGEADEPLGLYVKGFGQDLEGEVYLLGSTSRGTGGVTGVVLKLIPTSALLSVGRGWGLLGGLGVMLLTGMGVVAKRRRGTRTRYAGSIADWPRGFWR